MAAKIKIEIAMLGDFKIKYKDNVIDEKRDRSRKKWDLLKYLIAHREREISRDTLMDVFWGDDEKEGKKLLKKKAASVNPLNALKTQIHRLRTDLEKLGLPAKNELVISGLGGYALNPDFEYKIDAEEFREMCRLSEKHDISDDERLDYCLKALDIYKGDYLSGSMESDEELKWARELNQFFCVERDETVQRAIDILHKRRDFPMIIEVCEQALLMDELNHEQLHYDLIEALIEEGELEHAKEHYDYALDLFYNVEGVTPSKKFLRLPSRMLKKNEEYAPDLGEVKKRLKEEMEKDEKSSKSFKSAFFCEYEFFRRIYDLELRDAKRTNQIIRICMITMTNKDGGFPASEAVSRSAEKLRRSIGDSLRANDVYARYNASQFIIMLLGANYEVSEKIMKRIISRYRKDYPKSPVKTAYEIASDSEQTVDS